MKPFWKDGSVWFVGIFFVLVGLGLTVVFSAWRNKPETKEIPQFQCPAEAQLWAIMGPSARNADDALRGLRERGGVCQKDKP